MNIVGNIVDIPRKRIFCGEVKVEQGTIGSIAEFGPEDPSLIYILPGFIDSHIHIESTLLTPEQFAPMAAAHGVTGVISDPHEIANVLGMEGVEYMLRSAAKVRFNFHFAASPCVPSTGFETSGATLDSNDIKALLSRADIYGLGEMMNVPGLIFGDPEVAAKLRYAREAGKPIDGHAPGCSPEWVKACVDAGISTDHEIVSIEEARMKLDLGMKVVIREGSAARNYDILCPLLEDDSIADSLMFCSDDLYADELSESYIDGMVRESIRRGYPLWNVLKAACVNPVEHYGITDGLLREGDKADFIMVDSLTDFNVLASFVSGEPAGEKSVNTAPETAPNKFNAVKLLPEDIAVKAESGRIRVIGASDGSLLTESLICDAAVENGFAVSNPEMDIQKIIVYNRYTPGAKPAVGFIKGFGIKNGAMACSIGHDSHNITALGTSDEEIVKVVNAIVESRGGMAVSDGSVLETLPLPVAGLMSDEPGETVARRYSALLERARVAGCRFNAPFMTMAFMPLPVIPHLKITDISLFDADKFAFCNLFC